LNFSQNKCEVINKMKFNKFITLMLMMFLVSMIGVFADVNNGSITAVTISAPASASTYVTDTYTFSGTYTGNSSGAVAIYYNNTHICNDSSVIGDGDTSWSCVGSLSGVDAGECVALSLNASAYNETGDESGNSTADVTLASIYSDATSPSISAFTATYGGTSQAVFASNDYTVTATDSCSTLSYSVVLTKPDTTTVTKTTATGTWTETDVDMVGSYSVALTTTDSASNTATSSLSFDVTGQDRNSGIQTAALTTGGSSGTGFTSFHFMLGALAVLIVIGGGVVFFFSR